VYSATALSGLLMDIPLRVGLKAGANGGSGFERRVDFQLVQQRVVHGITIRVATQMRGEARRPRPMSLLAPVMNHAFDMCSSP
jgi:hypothetical protein